MFSNFLKSLSILKKFLFINLVIFLIIMLFSSSRGDVISLIFKVAGYTYGPLLGLFLFGMFTKISVKDTY